MPLSDPTAPAMRARGRRPVLARLATAGVVVAGALAMVGVVRPGRASAAAVSSPSVKLSAYGAGAQHVTYEVDFAVSRKIGPGNSVITLTFPAGTGVDTSFVTLADPPGLG